MALPARALALVLLGVALTLTPVLAEAPAPPKPTPVLDAPTYADACQVDFSWLLPGNPHGFLKVSPNGTFVWENGQRARFWGINISNRSLWTTHDEIDRVVSMLAHAGTNLVRFEALDSRGGLLDIPNQPGSRALDAAKLDTLHYWIARCKQAHMSYYLDLLDFREFKSEDGIEATLNRGARPYAMFDPHIIALQKEYATALLTTSNPYTGLRPVDDPDLALVEICNEHGFFINPESITEIVEPYRGRLRSLWNAWLTTRYTSRERLAASWKSLGEGEDPTTDTVALPVLTDPAGGRGPREVEPRLADGVAFLHDVQRAYFHAMMAHLREIGLRVPVTAVVSNDVAPDLASVAAECDFLSENFYADHPRFEGKDWEGKFHFRNLNQLRDGGPAGFAPYTCALRWKNKPVVIREWATVWPNRYRAVSVPQAVAYASLQDYDGMLLFGYKTKEYANRLMFFGYEADPTVWGLYSLGAAVFLRGDIAPSSASITLMYSLPTLLAFPNGITDTHRLAWLLRVGADTAEQVPPLTPPRTPRSLNQALAGGGVALRAPASTSLAATMTGLGFTEWSVQQRLQKGVYESSTRQIVLDTHAGLLKVGAPSTCMICGELDSAETVTAGALSVTTRTPVGAVMAVSLDGQPLAKARRFVVKMVTVAENTGQNLLPLPAKGPLPDLVLTDEGGSPVRTLGAPSKDETRVSIGGQPLLSVGMTNGTWELYVDGRTARFACDTPGVTVIVRGRRLITGRGGERL